MDITKKILKSRGGFVDSEVLFAKLGRCHFELSCDLEDVLMDVLCDVLYERLEDSLHEFKPYREWIDEQD